MDFYEGICPIPKNKLLEFISFLFIDKKSNLNLWVKEFNDKSDILMEKLRLLADGKKLITLYQEVNRFTLDVISSVS